MIRNGRAKDRDIPRLIKTAGKLHSARLYISLSLGSSFRFGDSQRSLSRPHFSRAAPRKRPSSAASRDAIGAVIRGVKYKAVKAQGAPAASLCFSERSRNPEKSGEMQASTKRGERNGRFEGSWLHSLARAFFTARRDFFAPSFSGGCRTVWQLQKATRNSIPPSLRRDRPESFLFLGETLRHARVRAGTSPRDYFLCKSELFPADGPSRLQRAPFRMAQSLSDPPRPRNSCLIHCNRAISLSYREIAECLRARRKSRGKLIGKMRD